MKNPLPYPHERVDAEGLPEINLGGLISFYTGALGTMTRRVLGAGIQTKRNVENRFINGEDNGGIHHKYAFAETMEALGYRTPQQARYEPTNPNALAVALAFMKQQNQKAILCKPENGSMGRGISIAETEEELIDFLLPQREPYILQEFLPPQKDFRYIVQRDRDQMQRICYEKHRPTVIGDGMKTLRQLILEAEEIPNVQKVIVLENHLKDLGQRPAKGETVKLVKSGNISQGAYGILPPQYELQAIDDVVMQAIQDLETQKGIHLSTYCFDIGTLENFDPNAGEQTQNIVFYEFQMPFGFSGYLKAPELKEKRLKTARQLLRTFQRGWMERNLR